MGAIPPHRSLNVPYVCGYADRLSAAPGETVEFKVNSPKKFSIDVVRLGTDVDDRASATRLKRFRNLPPAVQPINPGSYVLVSRRPTLGPEFTIEVWVRPWSFCSWHGKEWSAIISSLDYPNKCGFALVYEKSGTVSFYVGNGGRFRDAFLIRGTQTLKEREWHHLVASYGSRRGTIWVDREVQDKRIRLAVPGAATTPLRIAAAAERGRTDYFFDGDIAYPTLYSGILNPQSVRARYDHVVRGLGVPRPYANLPVIGSWDFDEERGDVVRDSSGNGHHGRILNHATWRVGGPMGEHDLREDPCYDPLRDQMAGHSLRFCSDDLVDCGWKSTASYKIPENAQSGYYAARVLDSRSEIQCHITFLVRPIKPASKIAVIASTNTWYAYNPESRMGTLEVPGLNTSFYNKHLNGSPTYYVGFRRPNPRADPYARWLDNDVDFSHLVRAERFVQSWLELNGYSYDLYSDLDLHQNSTLLKGYSAAIICCHSEYWSSEMRNNLSTYLSSGGKVVCLSANTMYWRVALDDGVMENRKFGGFVHDPNKVDETRFGAEVVMSTDGRRGGLLRAVGEPCHEILGLETYGAITPDSIYAEDWQAYKVKQPAHPLLGNLGLKAGDRFGAQSLNGPTACGNEFDIAVSSFASAGGRAESGRNPPGLEILASVEYSGALPRSGSSLDLDGRDMKKKPVQGADMIHWRRRLGGEVFNVGSMTFAGALSVDPQIHALMTNVLGHFGVKPGRPSSVTNSR